LTTPAPPSKDTPPRLSELPDAHIGSVGQFVSYLETHGNFDGLVFRGQRVDKPLVPKLSRLRARDMTRAQLEQLMLDEFMRTAPPHLDIVPASTVEWLAVARHYGMATRLLDWTFNPLAALWFVVERKAEHTDGVIWMLESDRLEHLASDEDALNIDHVKLVRPRHIVGRIVSQLGLFTIHPMVDDEFTPVERYPDVQPLLKKLTVDRGCYPEIKRVLDRCGVNASSIYPGLDGLVRQLQWAHTEQEG
jgi:hypothetical protein